MSVIKQAKSALGKAEHLEKFPGTLDIVAFSRKKNVQFFFQPPGLIPGSMRSGDILPCFLSDTNALFYSH
jgi:hypothetical protein